MFALICLGIDASAVKAEQDITDILRMLEELMKLKQGMQKENEEMAEKVYNTRCLMKKCSLDLLFLT